MSKNPIYSSHKAIASEDFEYSINQICWAWQYPTPLHNVDNIVPSL